MQQNEPPLTLERMFDAWDRWAERAEQDAEPAVPPDRREGTPAGIDGTALTAFGRRVEVGDRVRAFDVDGVATGTEGEVTAAGPTSIRVRFEGRGEVRTEPGNVDGFAPAV